MEDVAQWRTIPGYSLRVRHSVNHETRDPLILQPRWGNGPIVVRNREVTMTTL